MPFTPQDVVDFAVTDDVLEVEKAINDILSVRAGLAIAANQDRFAELAFGPGDGE